MEDSTRENISLQGLPVKLDIFEGPLDLLLHLIRENKVDITDIPIASITEQYLQYLELMRSLNLDVASEFLVMAATLMYIKSRLLLPVDEESEVEEGEDPRHELIRQLQEYQVYKEAGLELGRMEEHRKQVFGGESIGPEEPKRTEYPLEVSLFELLTALKKVVETAPEEEQMEIRRDRLTVVQRINEILEVLEGGEVPFENLFLVRKREQIIVTFLALLELMRLRMVRARQAVSGGQIMVSDIRPTEEDSGEEGRNGDAEGELDAGTERNP